MGTLKNKNIFENIKFPEKPIRKFVIKPNILIKICIAHLDRVVFVVVFSEPHKLKIKIKTQLNIM